MRSLTPIQDIAASVCVNDLGDSTRKYMVFVLDHMSDCFREMHLFMSDTFSVKTEVMPVGLVVDMPDDFIEPTKVGIKIDDKIYVLWRDYGSLDARNHPAGGPGVIGDPLSILDYQTPSGSIVPFYNYCGTNVLQGQTVGVNPSGFYTFDRGTGTIHVGSKWPADSEVVVEYKSDGVSDGLSLVPTEWTVALKEYAQWKYWMRKRDRVQANTHRELYLVQYYMIKQMYVQQPIDYQARIFQNTPRQTINNLM